MEKRKRRKLERRWRSFRLTFDRHAYVNQCIAVNDLIHQSKMEHFSRLVADHQSDLKRLFATVDKFLHLSGEIKIASLLWQLAGTRWKIDHFTEISKIRAGVDSGMSQLNDWDLSTHNISKVSCSNLSKFQPVSPDVIFSTTWSRLASCLSFKRNCWHSDTKLSLKLLICHSTKLFSLMSWKKPSWSPYLSLQA